MKYLSFNVRSCPNAQVQASSSKIYNDSVSMLKRVYSGRYSVLLKLSSRKFERTCTLNQNTPFLYIFFDRTRDKQFGAVPCMKFGIKTTYFQQ